MRIDWLYSAGMPRLGAIALSALVAYIGVVILLRLAGKRTLSQLNIFDLMLTVALGTMLASIVLGSGVSVTQGLVGIATLLTIQILVSWLAARVSFVRWLVKSEPRLVLAEGRFIDRAVRRERFARAEVLAAIRQAGYTDVEDVGAVVLETDGSFSVLPRAKGSALETVLGTSGSGAHE